MVVEKTQVEAANNAFKLCCQTKSASKMQIMLVYKKYQNKRQEVVTDLKSKVGVICIQQREEAGNK